MAEKQASIKVSLEIAKTIVEYDPGEMYEGFMFIQRMESDDQGKYQYDRYIFLHIETKKFYMYSVQRSGSYFSEYNFEYGEDRDSMVAFKEVRLREIKAFHWVPVMVKEADHA